MNVCIINVGSDVTVAYYRGLPRITVPLPSRKEHCSFTIKPITHTVGNFLDMLKAEDRGIDRACITSLGEAPIEINFLRGLIKRFGGNGASDKALRMIQHKIKALIDFSDGIRIASSNTIESLLEEDFKLLINDNEYIVSPPLQERCTTVSYHMKTSFPFGFMFL